MQLPANNAVNLPNAESESESLTTIVAGRLFDPYSCQFLENQIITISEDSGLIIDVRHISESGSEAIDYASPKVLDLRTQTVLPGFVDTHVHFFLHPYSETSWADQLTKETVVERTVRATIHARNTLMAGYTAVRDLGTEGAEDADLVLRKCLSGPSPLIPGPRYFCANRAIVTTGAYGPKSSIHVNTEGVEGITGAEVADGKDECIKAVRRQIGAGADWIKIYADYRFRSRVLQTSPLIGADSSCTFDAEEMDTLISTAHRHGVKVAAHATNADTVSTLLKLGVDTIEHGYDLGPESLDALSRTRTKWVPTLATSHTVQGGLWERSADSFKRALARGLTMNISCGGDTGVFAHGGNSLEMALMVRLGAEWKQVLRWGTLGGWECVRSLRWEGRVGEERLARVGELGEDKRSVGDNEVPFGAIRRGFAADVIATSGDLEADFDRAVSSGCISFVMKGGKVYKLGGVCLV